MTVKILAGDCIEVMRGMDADSIDCVVTSPELLAYCAGVIDSDGTIGIKKNSYAMRVVGDCTQATYSARICVRQVSTGALTILQSCFGGSVRPARTYAKHGRLMFTWEIRDVLAERALTAISPYLRIKKAQAENCLSLRALIAKSKAARVSKGRGHVGSAKRPTDISQKMEEHWERAKLLNATGIALEERRLP